jgi:hypothetical protein
VLNERRADPPRHELSEIDAAALEAARAVDVALAAAIDMEAERWVRYLTPLAPRLRDDGLRDLRSATRMARAAYGPKDSIRDALPEYATEPLLKTIDRLQKAIARYEAHRD